jgi:hypothetical protein
VQLGPDDPDRGEHQDRRGCGQCRAVGGVLVTYLLAWLILAAPGALLIGGGVWHEWRALGELN